MSRTPANTVRCAIYTRKSTEEGLEQEFNSLDAQRECCENYIASMAGEGWVCLPDRYDDGGFTGGNMERPALKRLMSDIEAGRIDCVVIYKYDRLSRSLLDFFKLLEAFEQRKVAFVSVTQQFNTATSTGRLMLNMLLSFAQFERELVSERTRDKIAAARRKGKWAGGHPVLGYDLLRSPGGTKLVVNEEEAKRVRHIFELYLECRSVQQTINRLDQLGWVNKAWTMKSGKARGGTPFNKSTLFKLLTNVAYLGQVRYKDQVYDGEHEAIVEEVLFQRVQAALRHNRNGGGSHVRNKHGALLKGLVRCKACGCGMSHHFAVSGPKRYRYYVCVKAQKRGWANCPGPSLPAHEIEQFVVDQIRSLGQNDGVLAEAVLRTQERLREELAANQAERRAVGKRIRSLRAEIHGLVESGRAGNGSAVRVAALREELEEAEGEASRLDDVIARADKRLIDEDELVGALEAFDPVWESLTPHERERLVHLLVRQVEYDAETQSVTIAFHEGGVGAEGPEEEPTCPAG
ncbi:MAG: recombinase family protein [Phycisphaerales bacterium JB054]